MKKTFEIDWQANKNFDKNQSTVAFSAVSGEEQYHGTVIVTSTNDALIDVWLGEYLPHHIRQTKELTHE